jgi:hypothetical protein
MSNGLKKLLYTQKQMEYIVEYIYHHRLAEPAWVAYLADKKAALEAGKPEPSPPPADPKSRRLALPNTLLPKELFVDIVSTSFVSFVAPL